MISFAAITSRSASSPSPPRGRSRSTTPWPTPAWHAILNFAPVQLKVRKQVKVKSVDLRINLESLSFYLKNVEDGLVS